MINLYPSSAVTFLDAQVVRKLEPVACWNIWKKIVPRDIRWGSTIAAIFAADPGKVYMPRVGRWIGVWMQIMPEKRQIVWSISSWAMAHRWLDKWASRKSSTIAAFDPRRSQRKDYDRSMAQIHMLTTSILDLIWKANQRRPHFGNRILANH